jgi:hypothetical protein
MWAEFAPGNAAISILSQFVKRLTMLTKRTSRNAHGV